MAKKAQLEVVQRPPMRKPSKEELQRACSALAILSAQVKLDLNEGNQRHEAYGIICAALDMTPQTLMTLAQTMPPQPVAAPQPPTGEPISNPASGE